jgi:putative tricarboxylic transport membrane protein
MNINRDAAAALVLMTFFLGYGYQATLIRLFPGQETEVFSPRTLPFALAVSGILLTVLQLFRALRLPPSGDLKTAGFDWRRAGLLCTCMLAYGWLFAPLGFVVATALFLAGSFLVLGERRIAVLVILPPVFAFVFWAAMTRGLGLYLAPGILGV